MLINGSKLLSCPVLSLHVGSAIASIDDIIIDPNNLQVIAFHITGPLIRDEVGDFLPVDSIREFSRVGIIIDSIDEFVSADDIIRLRDVLALNFSLTGLKVKTKSSAKLGKVSDFVINSASWDVHQLIVQRPIAKALLDPELIIARTAIIEVTDYEIIVKDEHEKPPIKSPATAGLVRDFVNPFRKPDFASDVTARSQKNESSSSGS